MFWKGVGESERKGESEREDGREGRDGGTALSKGSVCVYVSIDAPLCACLTAAWCLIYCKNGN